MRGLHAPGRRGHGGLGPTGRIGNIERLKDEEDLALLQSYDAIIIGAGHNGLVTAAYLAKSGKKVLVLERRPIIGGSAVTEEIFPGFKYSTCAHLTGTFSNDIIAELELKKYGLEILPLDPLLFAPALAGSPLLVPREGAKIAEAIGRFSRGDAGKFNSFCSLSKKLSCFLAALNNLPLPDGTKSGSLESIRVRETRLEVSSTRRKRHV